MSLDRGTATRLSLKKITKRLSVRNKDYSKVEDLYDTRVPLHNEDAFTHGLKFKAKFIGSLEISRPTCKVDIITAMRRIRYEFKVKGIRKIRSNLTVSTQGVKVAKRKTKRSRKRYTEDQLFIMQHPIYRIFYVSHDSQDMKIFSYISREMPDSTFRCNVFKAYKKNKALHIVRSLGQAFDVCHRLNPRPKKTKKEGVEGEGERKEGEGEGEGEAGKEEQKANGSPELGTDISAALNEITLSEGGTKTTESAPTKSDLIGLDFDPFSFNCEAGAQPNGGPQAGFGSAFSAGGGEAGVFPPLMVSSNPSGLPELPAGSASAQTQLQLMGRPRPRPGTTTASNQQNIIQENPFTDTLRTGSVSPSLSIGEAIDGPERMISNPFLTGGGAQAQQWEMHRQQMAAQMTMMKEQLKQETSARIESQARVEHLLQQNNQLLTHVQKLMVELEKLQSLQMAQILASGAQPPPPPPTSTPAVDPSSTLPVIPETSDPEPASIAAIIGMPPVETPPPPPEATPITSESETVSSLPVVANSTSSTSTSTLATIDSDLLSTPFDLPLSAPQPLENEQELVPLIQPLENEQESVPLIQPNEQGSPPEASTPVALETESPPPESKRLSPDSPLHADTANLPSNDPFAPQ